MSMRIKPPGVDNYTGSFVYLRIYVTSLTGVHYSGLVQKSNASGVW